MSKYRRIQWLSLLPCVLSSVPTSACAGVKAGTAVIDITPINLPVLVNGGFTSRTIGTIKSRLQARAVVLSSEQTSLAIVVVDTCMMSRDFLDETKTHIAARTGIPQDHLLISATHTHSAPSAMACLGTELDSDYVPYLRNQLIEVVERAQSHMVWAEAGFARIAAPQLTASRRWILRPDRIGTDPFGNRTVRANMHPSTDPEELIGETGPEDPELSLLALRTTEGRPLAVLANYSMHYFGDSDISADYFGLFCEGLQKQLSNDGACVAILSHGCSGDIWRRDYGRPETWRPETSIESYAAEMVDLANRALSSMTYQKISDLQMIERRLPLRYRVPDQQRLEWARRIVAELGDRLPQTPAEIYAREQIHLHEWQQTEVVIQALRIGEIAIVTTPCETYAITGLKLKAASPFPDTMVIELANGGDGYIPPPEQHLFGGYNTWAARTAGLEVQAEPKITENAIELLEEISGRQRRDTELPIGPASTAILKLAPIRWWRLNEFRGPIAVDSGPCHKDAWYEPAVTFALDGPDSEAFCGPNERNRALQFVGGRVRTRLPEIKTSWTVCLWIRNGLIDTLREETGWFCSRDHDHGLTRFGEHLGLGGTSGNEGKLIYQFGRDSTHRIAGQTRIDRWTWYQVSLVRDGESVQIYLNGKLEAEGAAPMVTIDEMFFGGRSDLVSSWEGRLDEIAIFDRALSSSDLEALFNAARLQPGTQTSD